MAGSTMLWRKELGCLQFCLGPKKYMYTVSAETVMRYDIPRAKICGK